MRNKSFKTFTEWRRGRPFWYLDHYRVTHRHSGMLAVWEIGVPFFHVELSVHTRETGP